MKLSNPILAITKPIILGLVICLLTSPITKSASAETLPKWEILHSTEIKLFGYYVFLKNVSFRDILTENEVSAIINELKQFQPKELHNFLHHTEDFLIYADEVAVKKLEYSRLQQFFVTYDGSNIKSSPTIDEALARANTEHPDMGIIYAPNDVENPLFMELAFTNNNNIIPLIQFFLDDGAAINEKNPTWGKTIFSSVGTLEIAKFLISNGADPTIIEKDGATPLMYAIYREASNELIKFLIDMGVDLHAKSPRYGTALDTAKEYIGYLDREYSRILKYRDQYLASEISASRARLAKAEEVLRIIEQALAEEANK